MVFPEPCVPNPCMINGECVNTDTDGDYSCECQVGYRGEQCEEEQSGIVWTPPFGWTGPD